MNNDSVYKIVELVGTSEDSVTDAIDCAIGKAAKSIRHISWFEVVQIRGAVKGGEVDHYQVTLKAGFALENKD